MNHTVELKHSFDPHIATEYGVIPAIIVENVDADVILHHDIEAAKTATISQHRHGAIWVCHGYSYSRRSWRGSTMTDVKFLQIKKASR